MGLEMSEAKRQRWQIFWAAAGRVWFGVLIGIIAGGLWRGWQADRDIREITEGLQIQTREMELERVKLESLIRAIEDFGAEVDEIILYMADRPPLRVRFMDAPEGPGMGPKENEK